MTDQDKPPEPGPPEPGSAVPLRRETGAGRAAGDPGAAARLRRDIDAGRTGDKVAFPDPAAAPLGTDDEAAGTPVTPAQAELAREAELGRDLPPPRAAFPWPAALAVVLLVIVVAMLVWPR